LFVCCVLGGGGCVLLLVIPVRATATSALLLLLLLVVAPHPLTSTSAIALFSPHSPTHLDLCNRTVLTSLIHSPQPLQSHCSHLTHPHSPRPDEPDLLRTPPPEPHLRLASA
jgi:hypothetical protein